MTLCFRSSLTRSRIRRTTCWPDLPVGLTMARMADRLSLTIVKTLPRTLPRRVLLPAPLTTSSTVRRFNVLYTHIRSLGLKICGSNVQPYGPVHTRAYGYPHFHSCRPKVWCTWSFALSIPRSRLCKNEQHIDGVYDLHRVPSCHCPKAPRGVNHSVGKDIRTLDL